MSIIYRDQVYGVETKIIGSESDLFTEITNKTKTSYDFENRDINNIPYGLFYYRNDLISLSNVKWSNINKVNSYAFYNCYKLTTIGLEQNSLDSLNNFTIGDYAFYNCYKLNDLNNINWSKVISVGVYGLYGCSQIEGDIDASLLSYLGDYAFSGCSKITSIKINNNNLYGIGNCVFRNCSNLKRVEFGSSLINWGIGGTNSVLPTGSVLETVIFNSNYPPSGLSSETSFTKCPNVKIYVPDSHITSYQNALPNVQDKIFPLSQAPTN